MWQLSRRGRAEDLRPSDADLGVKNVLMMFIYQSSLVIANLSATASAALLRTCECKRYEALACKSPILFACGLVALELLAGA